MRAGLRAFQERDAAAEPWLREEALPVAAATQADPGRGIRAEEVFADVRAHHARRLRDGSG